MAAVSNVLAHDADLVFVQELWSGELVDDVQAFYDAGYEGQFAPLATCTRVRGNDGGKRWEPWTALLTGDEGLYFSERRTLSERREARLAASVGTEVGQWGVGLFTRLEVKDITTHPLPQLARDKTCRSLIVATVVDQGHTFAAVALHGPHLSHGSLSTYRAIQELLRPLSTEMPVIIGGDFNCWRPLLRVVLPGWRSAVRGRTWPIDYPHSQIDHLLLRGPWRVSDKERVNTGSDHLALAATLTWP